MEKKFLVAMSMLSISSLLILFVLHANDQSGSQLDLLSDDVVSNSVIEENSDSIIEDIDSVESDDNDSKPQENLQLESDLPDMDGSFWQKPSTNVVSEIFTGKQALIYDMSTSVVVDSQHRPKQGEAPPKEDVLYLGWDGQIEVEVDQAVWADSPDMFGIQEDERVKRIQADGDGYLLLGIRVKNNSAQFGMLEDNDSVLMVNSHIQLLTDEPFRADYGSKPPLFPYEIDYYSLHLSSEDQYFYLSLPKGTEQYFELGYYIPRETLINDFLILQIGQDHNCSVGISLDALSCKQN